MPRPRWLQAPRSKVDVYTIRNRMDRRVASAVASPPFSVSARERGGARRGGQPGAGHPHRRLLNLGDVAVVLLRHTRLRTVRLLGILALWGRDRERDFLF